MQRTGGNAAVQRMLASGRVTISERVTTRRLQRGEASVHEGIETETTAGVDPTSRKEMYAGNWMRDFSQLNTPMVHEMVGKLPKDVAKPTGESIGAAGAEDIVTAVIRALAYLHHGVETTDRLVTPENIGRYAPEQHVDNPMGTTAADHLVRDTGTGLLRRGDEGFRTETIEEGGVAVAEAPSFDPDRDRELAAKAFPGLQVEDPRLYEVSGAGLGNHIYNAIEWAKTQLHEAVAAGPTPEGRMFLGSALHAVEDYFAHSNFIEVALNSEIGRAVAAQEKDATPAYAAPFLAAAVAQRPPGGSYVDTLYDAASPGGRQAVTTGTAGAKDIRVSLGQILLPKLPELSDLIDRKIDQALHLAVASGGKSTWEQIEEVLKTDEGGHAMLEVVTALDRHISVPIHDFRLTGPGIPFTDRFVPTGYETSQTTGGVVTAIRSYLRLYERITGYLDDAEDVVNILMPITMLFDLKDLFIDWFRERIAELSAAIKERKNELLLSLVAEITGIDLQDAKRRGLQDLVEHAGHEGVEHLRGGTSIAANLPEIVAAQSGAELGHERLYAAYGVVEGKPTRALPPSHSEVSKDHAPHFEGSPWEAPLAGLAAASPGYTVEEGSLFFGLHKRLAKEADAHIIEKVQATWDERAQESRMGALGASPGQDAERVLDEARDLSVVEQKRARQEGRTLRTYAEEGSDVADVMALVGLFISHPDDSTWWRPIMRAYVDAHEAEVLKHIRERNKTRSHRHP